MVRRSAVAAVIIFNEILMKIFKTLFFSVLVALAVFAFQVAISVVARPVVAVFGFGVSLIRGSFALFGVSADEKSAAVVGFVQAKH